MHASAIHRWLVDERATVLARTIDTAADVVTTPGAPIAVDAAQFAATLTAACEQRGLLEAYATTLTELRRARDGPGHDGPPIVPKPPYVTITSRGPVLRLPERTARVVICLAVCSITEDGQYRHRDVATLAELPHVAIKQSRR